MRGLVTIAIGQSRVVYCGSILLSAGGPCCKDPVKVRVHIQSFQTGERRSREGDWGEQGEGHGTANLCFVPAVETGPQNTTAFTQLCSSCAALLPAKL